MNENTKDILKIDQTQASILRLVLDDPDNKNALSENMMIRLKKFLLKASSDDSVKVVIISAVGDLYKTAFRQRTFSGSDADRHCYSHV